jgi:hypothetical protein
VAQTLTISDGTTSVSLVTTAGGVGYSAHSSGNDWGLDDGAGVSRVLTLNVEIKGSSLDDCLDKLNVLERLLADAAIFHSHGYGRRVSLAAQLDGATRTVTYDLLRGKVGRRPEPIGPKLVHKNRYGPLSLLLEVEPYGRTTEVTQVDNTGTLRGRHAGITHRYLHHTGGTVFSDNLISLNEGSLWQSSRFQIPSTVQTPAASDALYFGNTLSQFFELVGGVATAKTQAGHAGRWEFWDSAAWTAFVTTSEFRSANTGVVADANTEWNTATRLGKVSWTAGAVTGWATTTVNGVLGYWVRWRITTLGTITAPAFCNGPFRSTVGLATLSSTAVSGDVPARALLHFEQDNLGLSDDFSATAVDTTKWQTVSSSGAALTQASGVLSIAIGATASGESMLLGTTTYDLTGGAAQVLVHDLVTSATGAQQYLGLILDANNYLEMAYVSGTTGGLVMRNAAGGVTSSETVTFSSGEHRYWRIRHEIADDTVRWETAPDGQTWVERRSRARDLTVTALRPYLAARANIALAARRSSAVSSSAASAASRRPWRSATSTITRPRSW